jgi:hypothetical protein
VNVIRETDGRTYFTIADGFIAVGEEASLTTANAARYLSTVGPGDAVVVVVTYAGAPAEEVSPFKGRLRQQWANLSFGGQTATVTLNSVWDGSFQPIPLECTPCWRRTIPIKLFRQPVMPRQLPA